MPGLSGIGGEWFRWLELITVALTIGCARAYGFTFMFPLFSWLQLRGMLRFAVALGLGAPSAILVYGTLRESGAPAPLLWAGLVAKEAAIGAAFGALLGLPFWALQGMGDAIDVYRGGSAANLFDPVNAQEMTISGTLFTLTALAFFVVFGGVHETIDLIMRTQAVWPALSLAPPFEWARLSGLVEIMSRALLLAMLIAAPLMIAMFLVDVALVFAVRGAPSFHVYELTQAVRGLLLLMVLPVWVMLFESHFGGFLRGLLASLREALLRIQG